MDHLNTLKEFATNIKSTGKSSVLYRFIQTVGQVLPELKRIMIDQKEEDLFKMIIANKGKVTGTL